MICQLNNILSSSNLDKPIFSLKKKNVFKHFNLTLKCSLVTDQKFSLGLFFPSCHDSKPSPIIRIEQNNWLHKKRLIFHVRTYNFNVHLLHLNEYLVIWMNLFFVRFLKTHFNFCLGMGKQTEKLRKRQVRL